MWKTCKNQGGKLRLVQPPWPPSLRSYKYGLEPVDKITDLVENIAMKNFEASQCKLNEREEDLRIHEVKKNYRKQTHINVDSMKTSIMASKE